MGKCDEANVEMSMGDSASPLKQDIFSFTVPPEAPVFTPTAEEFQDPLAYINKIRPVAEKCGICKIKPPKNWQPPFAVDVDRLRFTPRIQRLNELEAITRVKLNFLDQIAKFWELQGSLLKIPTVERKPLDLYSLHKIVNEAGGFDVCTAERKWSKIAVRMGHPQAKGVGTILKNHYERILFPYDLFRNGEAIDVKLPEVKGEMTPEKANTQGGCKRGGSAQKGSPNTGGPETKPMPTRRWRKLNELDEQEGTQTEGCLGATETPGSDRKKDLRSKATPTKQDTTNLDDKKTPVKESPNKRRCGQQPVSMASCPHSVPSSRPVRSAATRSLQAQRQDSMTVNVVPAQPDSADPLAKYICHNCGRGDVEEQMLLCDGCDDSYHTFCLMPPLDTIPKGDWRCPPCIAQEVSKPTEAFGFEQAQREYTLQQFGEMADQFKSEYFNMPVHMVPTQTVEKEFWRIVSSIDEDVTVEYGADLHCMDHGSGFPTKASKHLYPGDQEYADSSWNLNNLPLLEGSVLGHINADISGMKVPWMYVGMCFATFCWHNEDHWSYSINYMHWGEPKTWYGVPGSKAEQFETTMRTAAPELFQWQPDLLHQLVTIMNPNTLMHAGVPVFRTDQNAGEFVITFPRAYHAGFNQGYNFAEAVNFTPADWLKIGRECIDHYSNLRRYCVFSHDELVCKMALEADKLEATVALATYQDMRAMLSQERKLRKSLLDWGVTEAEREAFELLPDDERQCVYCKTTCFLSAVTCPCSENLVCLRHYTELQHSNNDRKCPSTKHKLRYRFTLDELPSMLEKLKRRSEAVKEWADAVSNALDPNTPKTCDLEGLRAHLKKGQELKMHKADIVRALATAIEGAEKCASVIHQLDLNKMRTRTRHSADLKYKLTVEELTLFCEEIDGLACVLPEGSAVKEVLRQTIELERLADSLLVGDPGSTPEKIRDMEQCVERGSALCIQLPKLTLISNRLQQERFLDEVKMHREEYDTLNLETIGRLLDQGIAIQPHYILETHLAALHKLKLQVEKWEERAKGVLSPSGDHQSLEEIDGLLKSADKIEAYLPTRQHLNTTYNNAKEWLNMVEEMQSKESYPYFSTLESVVKRGQAISISLYEKDMLGEALDSARVWKEKTSRTFLKKGWLLSLMEALSPRTDVLTGAKRCVIQPPPPPPTPQTGRGRHHHNTSSADRSAANNNNNSLNNASSGSNTTGNTASGARAWSPPPSTPEAEQFMKCFSEERSPTQIVAAFKAAEEREMANMRDLRSRNLRKDIRMPLHSVTYCYCLKRQYGVMTQCDLCKEWYHASCINALPAGEAEMPPGRFLCPGCVRTKRPRLEIILGLLVALQKLPVRLAEGEALQCLTERAMAWQDVARALLASKEAAKGLATIVQTENAQAGGRGDKCDKLGGDVQRGSGNKASRGGAMSPTHDTIHNRNSSASEHAYSASPPANVGSSQGGSGGITASAVRTLRLSPQLMHKLEDLMMEGDLLEVTMAETQQMWGLLRAARDQTSVWSERGALGALTDISGSNSSALNDSRESPVKRVGAATHQQQMKRARRTKEQQQQQMLMMMQQQGGAGTPGNNSANSANNAVLGNTTPSGAMNKSLTGKKMRKASPAAPRRASAPAPTITNYLNRKQQGVAGGSGLMMKKHFLAKQERRRRGMTTKQSTRGRRAGVHTKMKRGGGAGMNSGGPGRLLMSSPAGNAADTRNSSAAAEGGLLGRSASPQTDDDDSSRDASSNEDDEDCAASTCLRPTGKEVDWVQCDGGCEKWFHLHCVGLSKNSLKADEDYYCSICSNGVSGKKANKPRDTGNETAKTRGNERGTKEERTTKNSTKQTNANNKTETKRERLSLEAKRLAAESANNCSTTNIEAVGKKSTSDNLMCEEKMDKDEDTYASGDSRSKSKSLSSSKVVKDEEFNDGGDVKKMDVDDALTTTTQAKVLSTDSTSLVTSSDSVEMKDDS